MRTGRVDPEVRAAELQVVQELLNTTVGLTRPRLGYDRHIRLLPIKHALRYSLRCKRRGSKQLMVIGTREQVIQCSLSVHTNYTVIRQ